MVRILATDTIKEIASKIYYGFELHQSCGIDGLELVDGNMVTKGSLVIRELTLLDLADNTEATGKKIRRKRVTLPNSVGGFIAQKIFRYEEREHLGTIRTTIWRIQ
ncbi:MAG: hypothetical protein E6Q68_01725 [Polynucleobacter sp.]|nr:MAG: hypothetical protein E6Q68_01725 [Polynucleobacter sp.]